MRISIAERALPARRHVALGVERIEQAILEAEPHQAGGGEDHAREVHRLDLGDPGRHVAADRDRLEVGAQRAQQRHAPRGAGADARARRQRGEAPARRADERVARVLALRLGADRQPVGERGRQVLRASARPGRSRRRAARARSPRPRPSCRRAPRAGLRPGRRWSRSSRSRPRGRRRAACARRSRPARARARCPGFPSEACSRVLLVVEPEELAQRLGVVGRCALIGFAAQPLERPMQQLRHHRLRRARRVARPASARARPAPGARAARAARARSARAAGARASAGSGRPRRARSRARASAAASRCARPRSAVASRSSRSYRYDVLERADGGVDVARDAEVDEQQRVAAPLRERAVELGRARAAGARPAPSRSRCPRARAPPAAPRAAGPRRRGARPARTAVPSVRFTTVISRAPDSRKPRSADSAISPAPISSTRLPLKSSKISRASATPTRATETDAAPSPVSVRTRLAARNACWNSRPSTGPTLRAADRGAVARPSPGRGSAASPSTIESSPPATRNRCRTTSPSRSS